MANSKRILPLVLALACAVGFASNTKAESFGSSSPTQFFSGFASALVASVAEGTQVVSTAAKTILPKDKDAAKDCFYFKQGEHPVTLPLVLEGFYGELVADQKVETTSCNGRYQLPLSFDFAIEVNKWLESAGESKSKTFDISVFGLGFDVEMNKTKSGEGSPSQIYSIVRLKGRTEIEKDLNDKGMSLNFGEGYITTSKDNKPVHTGNFCPLLARSEIGGRLWIVFPTNSAVDMCKEYK